MSLAASRLAIGETGCHTTFKNGLHKRFSCEPNKTIRQENNHIETNQKQTLSRMFNQTIDGTKQKQKCGNYL